MQKGYFDDVPVARVKEFQKTLQTFLTDRKADLLRKVSDEKALTDDIAKGLSTAIEDFKKTWK
jgi:F-type H+-transporting ATPase subunit alpha